MKSIHSIMLVAAASTTLFATASMAAQRPDNRIDNEIYQTFMTDDSLMPGWQSGIKVTTQNGVVTLKGRVPTDQVKQQLHDTLANLPGVQTVDDSRLAAGPAMWLEPESTQ